MPYVLLTLLSSLGIAFLLAHGSQVQALTVAFLSGHTSSLYDGENVAQLVGAGTYLKIALWPPYLLTGLISSVAMIRSTSKMELLIWGAGVIGTALTVIDVFSAGVDGIVVSALCNFAAGFVISVLTLVLALNSYILRELSGGNIKVEAVLWVMWPFAGYISLAAVLFFVLGFLTTVPSMPVSFRLAPSLNGYYVAKNNDACKVSDYSESSSVKCKKSVSESRQNSGGGRGEFSILGDFKSADKGSVKFTGFGDGLTFEWSKGVEGLVTGSLWMAQGCIQKDRIKEIMKLDPIFKGDLRSLKISLDKGMLEFRVIEPKSQGIQVADGEASLFWITPLSDNSDQIKAERFLKNGIIRTSDQFDPAIYELAIIPLDETNRGPNYKSRKIAYIVNDESPKNIDVSMESNVLSPDAALNCQYLPTHQIEGVIYASANIPYVSLVVSIDPPKLLSISDIGKINKVMVSGISGWISSEGYPAPDLHKVATGGELSQLSIIGAVKDLVVDGRAIATGENSTLQVNGNLTSRTAGATFLVEGNVDYLILNGKRLTATRWEQLDAGVRIPLILGVPAAVYFMLNFIVFTLRRKVNKIWLFPS